MIGHITPQTPHNKFQIHLNPAEKFNLENIFLQESHIKITKYSIQQMQLTRIKSKH